MWRKYLYVLYICIYIYIYIYIYICIKIDPDFANFLHNQMTPIFNLTSVKRFAQSELVRKSTTTVRDKATDRREPQHVPRREKMIIDRYMCSTSIIMEPRRRLYLAICCVLLLIDEPVIKMKLFKHLLNNIEKITNILFVFK